MSFEENLANIAQAFLGNAGNQSLAASGYQKLPSGLIIQWVSASTASTGRATGSWPIPFPGALLCSTCSVYGAGALTSNYATIGSGANSTTYDAWINSAGAGIGVAFIAVGY